ncbi:MAG: GDYXXLXY domain-containing protein [Elusimicrobia bacterium]|nr:GDYXXLXY domain-containing protein [Elusimicrobiota bacterium]
MRVKLFLLFIFLICAALVYSVWQKESVLKSGKTFYMQLRPVDPRSLMQGDYMALRYAEDSLCLTLDEKNIGHSGNKADLDSVPPEALLSDRQAEVDQTIKDAILKSKAGKCDIKLKNNLPSSFFFQEGYAGIYSRAKYAILKYDGKDTAVLYGLTDENLQELKP